MYNHVARNTVFIAVVILAAVLCILFYFRLIWFVYPNRSQYPVRGIDLSHHQGTIDWKQVADSDVSFAYIKATEADDFRDTMFAENSKKAHEAGIKIGAYHFYSSRYPGKIQAENFIATVATSSIDLPPVVDLEFNGNAALRPTKEAFQKELKDYMDMIRSTYHTEPIIYTTYAFFDRYLYPEYKASPIWIRDVFSQPDEKIQHMIFWQYNPRGRVAGITGSVDLNVFNGTREAFMKLK